MQESTSWGSSNEKESQMMLTDRRQRVQQLLKERSNCRFVDSEEFCSLLLGFRRLVRADNLPLDLHGLLDQDTKMLYLIERQKLASLSPSCHRQS